MWSAERTDKLIKMASEKFVYDIERARSLAGTHTLTQTEHTSLLGFYRITFSDVVFIRLIWTYLLLLHSHRRKHRRKLWACVLIADGPGL